MTHFNSIEAYWIHSVSAYACGKRFSILFMTFSTFISFSISIALTPVLLNHSASLAQLFFAHLSGTRWYAHFWICFFFHLNKWLDRKLLWAVIFAHLSSQSFFTRLQRKFSDSHWMSLFFYSFLYQRYDFNRINKKWKKKPKVDRTTYQI